MRVRTSALLVILAACSDPDTVDLGSRYQLVSSVPPLANPKLDVLFVVDDSGSIQPEAAQVAAKAQAALFDVIGASLTAEPDLRVGVITSSMTIASDVDGCGGGDHFDGRLLLGHLPECPAATERWLSDAPGELGEGRVRNFDGPLADALACRLPQGSFGCGFEQPFAAVVRALSGTVTENVGFLRDDALLVVIFLTDEDDCSATDPVLYAYEGAPPELGPPTSYRCFRGMVACDESLDTPGVKNNCHPATLSPYALSIDTVADALRAAKGGVDGMVFVSTIAGAEGPVSVTTDAEDNLLLAESCTSSAEPGAGAAPPLRMLELARRFPGRSWSDTLCDADLTPTLRRTGDSVGDIAGRRGCLRGPLFDIDATTDGLQVNCHVFASTTVTRDGGAAFEVEARIVADPATCDTEHGLRVEIPRGEELAGLHLVTECQTR